jgi:hypothetical protein
MEEKIKAPVLKSENTAVGFHYADQMAPLYPQNLALTSSTSDGCSFVIVRSRAQAMEFSFSLV